MRSGVVLERVRIAKPRLPDVLICGVDDPEVDHGDDTRGGSGS